MPFTPKSRWEDRYKTPLTSKSSLAFITRNFSLPSGEWRYLNSFCWSPSSRSRRSRSLLRFTSRNDLMVRMPLAAEFDAFCGFLRLCAFRLLDSSFDWPCAAFWYGDLIVWSEFWWWGVQWLLRRVYFARSAGCHFGRWVSGTLIGIIMQRIARINFPR